MHEAVAEAPDRDARGITEGGEGDDVPSRREGGANAREEDGGCLNVTIYVVITCRER